MTRKPSVPERLRRQEQERAQGRCEYCLIHEADHVMAEKHGGATSLENLAWACFYCNRFKGSELASVDPTSQKVVFLFNPREQRWNRHFRLNGGRIEGITWGGRATVALLHLNDADFLLSSVAPDFAWVGDPPGSCFLDPGAHLVFVLVEPIAATSFAPRERFRRLAHQALSQRGAVWMTCVPTGSG